MTRGRPPRFFFNGATAPKRDLPPPRQKPPASAFGCPACGGATDEQDGLYLCRECGTESQLLLQASGVRFLPRAEFEETFPRPTEEQSRFNVPGPESPRERFRKKFGVEQVRVRFTWGEMPWSARVGFTPPRFVPPRPRPRPAPPPAPSKRAALQDAFDVLGLPITATRTEVKRRRKQLARELHTDHGGNAAANERLAVVNAATDEILASFTKKVG